MLKINFDNTDISRQQARYEYQESVVAFDGTKELLIGFTKPIYNLYLNLLFNEADRDLSVKYFNGTEFTQVKGMLDLTYGLSESGFLSWDKNQIGEAKTTLLGESLYWYKLSLVEEVSVTFKGISTLFSDDFDLKSEYPSINEFLPDGVSSFVKFHESARKAIITDLRKSGITVQGIEETKRKQLDAFDILDKEEVREASKFLALSKIFNWVSDTAGDKYEILSNDYAAEAAGALTPLISLDTDNDGKEDDGEVAGTQPVLIGRL